MARISQYKALGTKMGGYKSTLSKVKSMEYAKKHAAWKAGEEKALYGEIGKTVSNIIGIAQERKRLKDLEPLPTPDRPEVKSGPGQQSPEDLEDAGGVRSQNEIDFGMESDTVGKIETSEEFLAGLKDSEVTDWPSVKPLVKQDYSDAPVGRGASQSMKLSPNTTSGALPMVGVHLAEKGRPAGVQSQSEQGYSIWGEDSVGAGDATYPTDAEAAGIHPVEGGREFAGAFDNLDELKDIQINIPENLKPAYPTSEEVSEIHPAPGRGIDPDRVGNQPNVQPGTPDNPRPDWMKERLNSTPDMVTDDMAFNVVKELDESGFDMKSLPYPSGKMEAAGLKHLQKMPGFEGLRGSDFDQMFQEWMGTESAGRNVRQEINKGELGTGKGTGRAGGLWQMERGFDKDAEGNLKGRGYQTALQRYVNMNEMFGEKVPAWVADAKGKDTPEDLTPQQQRELVFANMFMQEQSYGLSGSLDKKGNLVEDKRFDILRRALKNKNYGELWARKHWAGSKPGTAKYKEKIEQYERDKERAREYRY